MNDQENILDISRFFIMLCGRLDLAARFETIIALSAPMILLGKELGNPELENVARHWQLIALERWKSARSDEDTGPANTQCLFCGKSEPDVKLAAGARGYICHECIGSLGRAFESDSDSR